MSVITITEGKKPEFCFICGEKLDRKKWGQDYCQKHEDGRISTCTSPRDWAVNLEKKEQGW